MPHPFTSPDPSTDPPLSGLLTFFDTVLGDPCSAFVVALIAHGLAVLLLGMTPASRYRKKRWGILTGVSFFLLLAYAEYARQGPAWLPIFAVSGIRGWLIASMVQFILGATSLFHAGVLGPLRFRRHNLREHQAHEEYQARLAEERRAQEAAAREDQIPPSPAADPPPRPPPVTFESELAETLARFEQMKEAILRLPIPQDDQEARIRFLKDKLDEQINVLMEKYCT
jgi:hypothetical protein